MTDMRHSKSGFRLYFMLDLDIESLNFELLDIYLFLP